MFCGHFLLSKPNICAIRQLEQGAYRKMEKLLNRYENEMGQVVDSVIRIGVWEYPSEVFCCKKGACVFIELKNREEMYRDLCNLLKGVS